MKQITLKNGKLRELQWELNRPLYEIVGLLQTLWMITAEECPEGDIGRFSNEEIARKIQWKGDVDELIEALLKLEWLDYDNEHRYLIHQWPEHCEEFIHLQLARAGKNFADGTEPRVSRLAKKERQRLPGRCAGPEELGEHKERAGEDKYARRAHGEHTASTRRAHETHTKPIANSQLTNTSSRSANAKGFKTIPVSAGEILANGIGGFIKPLEPEEVINLTCAVFGEHWRPWIGEVLCRPEMKNGALADIYDEVTRIQGAIEGTRQEVGKPKDPQRLFGSSITHILKRYGCRKWPQFPKK